MASYSIDSKFIFKNEAFKLEGYVPSYSAKSVMDSRNKLCYGKKAGEPIGRSGLTVGGGVDLGQMNERDLRALYLSPQLHKVLLPFTGIKGKEAQKLKLALTHADAMLLTERVKSNIIRAIVHQYEADSKKAFILLDTNIQTAVIDYYYQWGQHAMKSKKNPNSRHVLLWKLILQNDWLKVIEFLRSQKDYETRRKAEAKLIEDALRQIPFAFEQRNRG